MQERRRKFYGWGYEDDSISPEEISEFEVAWSRRLDVDKFVAIPFPKADEISLRAPRVQPPASLKRDLHNGWHRRLNSFVRRCDSRSETLRLTVARGAWRRRAAADRLPTSTTVKKIDIASRRSIADSFHNLERQLSFLAHSGTFERSYLKRRLIFE
jgi:hypothetical protein